MVITESELRELWRDGKHPLPPFPLGARFTPAAQDFLKDHHLEIHFEAPQSLSSNPPISSPDWNKPAVFPVVLTGPVPVCAVCGQPVHHKPEHVTQLDAGHFAPKTHPRIQLRGQVDSLHALVMLVAAEARRYQLPRLAAGLDTLAAYCREIQSAEYQARPVQSLALLDKSEDELHDLSHWPDKHLGLPHLTPGPDDHAILHWLNYTRTQVREVEILALEAEAAPDVARALNRLSSAVYVLALMFKQGRLSWQV